MTPTLLDLASTWAKVRRPNGLWSRMRMPDSVMPPISQSNSSSGAHQPGLQRRGGGDHLERRARLVDVDDRAVAPVWLAG